MIIENLGHEFDIQTMLETCAVQVSFLKFCNLYQD